jgi:hypothetical protein
VDPLHIPDVGTHTVCAKGESSRQAHKVSEPNRGSRATLKRRRRDARQRIRDLESQEPRDLEAIQKLGGLIKNLDSRLAQDDGKEEKKELGGSDDTEVTETSTAMSVVAVVQGTAAAKAGVTEPLPSTLSVSSASSSSSTATVTGAK